ncbi:DUF3742 family protein [Pseudomonas citronellolis]|nr:DUF3742 family protein [Pseudomonas citronellolis]
MGESAVMAHRGTAERFGCWLAKQYRRLAHQELRLTHWAIRRGVPSPIARALPWLAKLIVLGLLLYVAFWLALLFGFAFAGAWVVKAESRMTPEQRGEWRDGQDGHGFYRDGHRVD